MCILEKGGDLHQSALLYLIFYLIQGKMKADPVPHFRSCEEQQIPFPEDMVGSFHNNR